MAARGRSNPRCRGREGALFQRLTRICLGLGIDPEATESMIRDLPIRRGTFPSDVVGDGAYDAITLLAYPSTSPPATTGLPRCMPAASGEGGQVIMTGPSPIVDHITELLRTLHLLPGMGLHEHCGINPRDTVALFTTRGFVKERHSFPTRAQSTSCVPGRLSRQPENFNRRSSPKCKSA